METDAPSGLVLRLRQKRAFGGIAADCATRRLFADQAGARESSPQPKALAGPMPV